MLRFRSRRLAALLCVTALGTTAIAATPAQAQLGGLLDGGGLLTDTGQTLGNLAPGVDGVLTGVTGTVGGVVGGVQGTVTGVVDQTLGGVVGGGGGLLPGGVLDSLLLVLMAPGAPGAPGATGIGGPLVLSGGSIGPGGVIIDASAPRPKVKVLSKLRSIGRTGKMRLEVSTNEPGIVALRGNVRPGRAVKSKKRSGRTARSAAKHSRKLVKIPSLVLGYRRAGKLTLTVKLSRAAQRTLGRSRDARMSVATLAADVFRNQDSDHTKLRIKR